MESTSEKRFGGRAEKNIARRRRAKKTLNSMVCHEAYDLFHLAGMEMQDLEWFL